MFITILLLNFFKNISHTRHLLSEIHTNLSFKQIWDTAGQDRFRQITRTYYRGAHAALIVFDLSNMSSFRNVQLWLREILDSVNAEKPFLFLVGTKMDLITPDTLEFFKIEGAKIANQIEAEYWIVSSTTGENVRELFHRVACLCFNEYIDIGWNTLLAQYSSPPRLTHVPC